MTNIRLYMRQKQLFRDNDPFEPIIVQKNVLDGTVSYIDGTVSQEWIEYTDETEGLTDLKFSWSAVQSDYTEGDRTEGNQLGSNYDKGLSSNLVFTGKAFQFIYDTLLKYSYQTLNSIEVHLLDTHCDKYYRLFEIKRDNVEYAPFDEPCIVRMVLREADPVWHAFQKTPIEDNWQNWFNKDPNGAPSDKEHPQVAFVVEQKPKFIMVALVALIYLCGMLSVGILTGLSAGKEWIRKILGAMYFCPSPLIRTYLQNICDKYGYTMDTIFDDVPSNPYKNTALFFPAQDSYRNFDQYVSPSRAYLWNNRTAYPMAKFLNMLKRVFAAEWYVTPERKLVFKHRDYFDNLPPIYDFTAQDAIPIYKLRYRFNGKKKPAYGNYSFPPDPQDSCSNEIQDRYKTIVDFDGQAENPMLEGNITKSFEFGCTAFYRDGTSEPYMSAAIRIGKLVASGAVILGLIELLVTSNLIFGAIAGALLAAGFIATDQYMTQFINSEDIDGCVRMSSKECNMPRLIDLTLNYNIDRAKAFAVTEPEANPRYNDGEFETFSQAHLSNDGERCDVPGAEAWDWVGCNQNRIYNYRFNIDEKFVGNLYTNALEIENPIYAMDINQEWELELDKCCEVQELFGVFEDDFAKIGGVVILERREDETIKGRITNIEVDENKSTMVLKGVVIEPQVLRPGAVTGVDDADCSGGECITYAVNVTEFIERDAEVTYVDCCGDERTIMIREEIPEFPSAAYICALPDSIVADAPVNIAVADSAGCVFSSLQIKNTTTCYDITRVQYETVDPRYGFDIVRNIQNPVTIRRSHGLLYDGRIKVTVSENTVGCTAYLCFRVNGHLIEPIEVTAGGEYTFGDYNVYENLLVEVWLTDEECVVE